MDADFKVLAIFLGFIMTIYIGAMVILAALGKV